MLHYNWNTWLMAIILENSDPQDNHYPPKTGLLVFWWRSGLIDVARQRREGSDGTTRRGWAKEQSEGSRHRVSWMRKSGWYGFSKEHEASEENSDMDAHKRQREQCYPDAGVTTLCSRFLQFSVLALKHQVRNFTRHQFPKVFKAHQQHPLNLWQSCLGKPQKFESLIKR